MADKCDACDMPGSAVDGDLIDYGEHGKLHDQCAEDSGVAEG